MSQQDTKEEIVTPLIEKQQNIQGGPVDSFAESEDGGKLTYRESKTEEGELTEDQYLQQQALVMSFRERKIVKILFLTGIFSVGLCYYNNNFHGLLKEYIIEKTNVSETEFQLFSTLSSGPSVPLIFSSGILLDVIGVSTGMSIYLAVMLVGGWLQVIAGSMNSFYFLVVGRVVGGIGLMMASGAESALLAKWYSGGELATYNGIYLALVRTAQLLAALLYPKLYLVTETLEFPLLIAAFIITLAYALSMLCCIMDLLADKQMNKVSKLRKVDAKTRFKFSDFKKFDSFFWTVVAAFLINYTIQYPYVQNIQTIFQRKFQLSSEQTGEIQSIAYFIGLSCPFFGFLIKKFGRRFEWLILGSIFGLASFFYIGIIPECETACYGTVLPSIIFFGLFLTFFQVVLIPAVAIAAPLELVGTAYGVAYGSKNLGEAVIPIITIGPLLDNLHVDYTIGFFIAMCLISLCLSLILWQWNKMREAEVPREEEEMTQKEDIIVSRTGTMI